jgi:hypothetical protein
MNPEGEDVYWSTGGVISGINDVLKVEASKHVLNHGSVVIDLTDPLWRIGNCLTWASVVPNEIRHTPGL